MKLRTVLIIMLALTVCSFLAGYLAHRPQGRTLAKDNHRVIYYIDPMHPAYRSDKPGIAPDCGMQLEPVYADNTPAVADGGNNKATLPPGTIQISPDKQQLIGVKVATVGKEPWSHTIRLLGRIAPDEGRLYRINAATDMWVRKTFGPTTGSTVRKDDRLMSFYTTTFLSAAASYMYALTTEDRQKADNMLNPSQQGVTNLQLRQAIDSLLNMGVSQAQIDEMAITRKIPDLVDVRSPIDGIILSRSVTLGQYVSSGTELYRIADLSKIWIFADFFGKEALSLKPGMSVRVTNSLLDTSFSAQVSNISPQFDPVSRTLKVRLEATNPGKLLRPDMFVDMEMPISGAPTITVPAEAILDSGLKKTVFVDRGNGYFEPRTVETGQRSGERIEITHGLLPGEKIVVSGTFLIDSESRLKSAASGISGTPARDPACGMDIDLEKARTAGRASVYRGQNFYFCSADCKQKFDHSPERYGNTTQTSKNQRPPAATDHPMHD